MKHKTLRGLQLLLGLLLFAAGSGQTGGVGLVVQTDRGRWCPAMAQPDGGIDRFQHTAGHTDEPAYRPRLSQPTRSFCRRGDRRRPTTG